MRWFDHVQNIYTVKWYYLHWFCTLWARRLQLRSSDTLLIFYLIKETIPTAKRMNIWNMLDGAAQKRADFTPMQQVEN